MASDQPGLRRSSTSRSIGNRGGWEAFTNVDTEDTQDSTNGDTDGIPPEVIPAQRRNSVGYLDEAALEKQREADINVAHYVTNQLERMRTTSLGESVHDEFEAQLDGA